MSSMLQNQLGTFAVDVLRLCVWLMLLMAIFVPLERFFGRRRQRVFRNSFGLDLAYYFLSSLLPKLILAAPLTILAMGMHRIAPSAWYAWVGELPFWARLVAALIVGETGAYWGHRWSHEIPWLWRFHAIHHSAEEMDWLVNSRAHPVDLVFTRFCSYAPMYALGLAQPIAAGLDVVPALVALVGTIWGFFIHANVNWRLGWFEVLISSPAFHHWHHTNDGPERVNKNYAAMLPLVDKCFGTYYLPNEWPETYGIDAPVSTSLAGQLLHPTLARPATLVGRDPLT